MVRGATPTGTGISDVDEERNEQVDSDDDGTPDWMDNDSDGDGVLDATEGSGDYDLDGTGNWRDLDSDGDCRSDALEWGGIAPPVDTDVDGHPDFLDRDSDGDGLLDAVEDANCNGVHDGTETDALDGDTDDDGESDLAETVVGTNPNDPASSSTGNGDFVFIEPYMAPPSPPDDTLEFTSAIHQVDVYVILDRSGSMTAEINSIRNNLGVALFNLTCPPLGNGNPDTCIPDLWAGAGTVGYSGSSGGQAYVHAVDMQPNPNVAGLNLTEPGGCCAEPLTFSIFSAITGQGTASVPTCGIQTVAPRATCAGSPAANAGFAAFGYPCFRQGALPVVVLATDEPPLASGPDPNPCPSWSTVVLPQLLARSARFIGIYGDGVSAQTISNLQEMAVGTSSTDSLGQPLVFQGAGAFAADALEDAIGTLANGLPLDLGILATDDPADAIDAVAAFVDHFETLQLGTPECSDMLLDVDTNSDSFDDAYVNVAPRTPVCWKVVARPNTTVPATDAPQLFRVTVDVQADGITEVDTRDIYFIVPALAPD